MAKKYWLIKSEPSKYPWQQLLLDGKTNWDGVRNYAARLNLMAMQKGDHCLFYHSNEGKEIVGIAQVSKTHFPDATATEGNWVAVEVMPIKSLKNPVTLSAIKNTPALAALELIRLSRLSVSKVKKEEYELIIALSLEGNAH